MPTNANTFNSRVTSEALEAKFRQVFPSQGGAELPQDLFASGVIQPVIDFSSVAEGSILGTNLQTAWDFSTGSDSVVNRTATIINNTGFWQIDFTISGDIVTNPGRTYRIELTDGITPKRIWALNTFQAGASTTYAVALEQKFVVFVNSGQSVQVVSPDVDLTFDLWYRQIADINGTLVNPLGFTFS